MRWENLFDDLEGQLELELGQDELDLRAEEERFRLGRLALRDRLKHLVEQDGAGANRVRIDLATGSAVTLRLKSVGKDWVSGELRTEAAVIRNCIVPLSKIASITLSRVQINTSLELSQPQDSRELSDRLGFGLLLRDLARRRLEVAITVGTSDWNGTIDRVGRDHLDLAIHEIGSPRRESAVLGYRLIPLDQIILVRL